MANYNEYGYDNLLQSTNEVNPQRISGLAFDQFTQDISGNKVQGGVFTSIDGHIIFDLENEILRLTDGAVDKLVIGKLFDGTFGFSINNNNGSEIARINENGITISNGQISSVNSDNTTVTSLTGEGIQSDYFKKDILYVSNIFNTRTFPSGGWNDIDGLIAKFTNKNPVTMIAFLNLNIQIESNTSPPAPSFRIVLDGQKFPVTPTRNGNRDDQSVEYVLAQFDTVPGCIPWITTVTPGNHTLRAQWTNLIGGTDPVTLLDNGTFLQYILLGR